MDPDIERRIRSAYAAFARGDLEGTLADFDAESEVASPDYALEGGSLKGREGAAASFQGTLEWVKIDSIEIEELLEGPEGVLAMIRMRGEGRTSGVPVDVVYAHAIELDDVRVRRITWFDTREEGLAAVGLAS